MVLMKSFLQVAMLSLGVAYLVYLGYFKDVFTELGVGHYAERSELPKLLPAARGWLKMPWNTAVCFGYLVVGIYWLIEADGLQEQEHFSYSDAYLMAVFNWMAVLYGPVQCMRIVTQLHQFAVLDQWFTLPFFAWVIVWARHCSKSHQQPWSRLFPTAAVALSLTSYTLALYMKHGFEVSLGVHIILAIYFGCQVYWKHPNRGSKSSLVKGVLCCVGFVVLKLLDLHLVEVHWIFTVFSGHFISKVCDILQIQYVNSFFMNSMQRRNEKFCSEHKKTK